VELKCLYKERRRAHRLRDMPTDMKGKTGLTASIFAMRTLSAPAATEVSYFIKEFEEYF